MPYVDFGWHNFSHAGGSFLVNSELPCQRKFLHTPVTILNTFLDSTNAYAQYV